MMRDRPQIEHDGLAAGVEIIDALEYKNGYPILFTVKFLCCGAQDQRTRKQLTMRRQRSAYVCNHCNKRRKRSEMPATIGEDYGVTPPSWPVPRLDLIGVNVPFYDRAAA